ncbi:MAG: enoyl-CoA hydratase/isomerase family protein [bacterium]
MGFTTIWIEKKDSVGWVWLNRPDVRNAFDEVMIDEMHKAITDLQYDNQVRAVVITGKGSAFCAGADINWMKRMKDFTYEENLKDALALAGLLYSLYNLPKPTIAAVNGASIGGSNGIVAACDIAIASHRAEFSLSEVRIGLVPACIGPYLVRKIGEGGCRRLFLTGERISADEAFRLGLVNQVVTHENLMGRVDEQISTLIAAGPAALAMCKHLISSIGRMSLEEAKDFTSRMIAELRCSDEAQEGMKAFLEKRLPRWQG